MEPLSTDPAPLLLLIPSNAWGHKKIKLKNKYGILSEDDLAYEPGKENELSARLQARLNLTADELHKIINAL